jgi:hypothetical protein
MRATLARDADAFAIVFACEAALFVCAAALAARLDRTAPSTSRDAIEVAVP